MLSTAPPIPALPSGPLPKSRKTPVTTSAGAAAPPVSARKAAAPQLKMMVSSPRTKLPPRPATARRLFDGTSPEKQFCSEEVSPQMVRDAAAAAVLHRYSARPGIAAPGKSPSPLSPGRGGPSSSSPPATSRRELVNGQWRPRDRLGFGSFGDVYLVTNILTGEQAAMKIEPNNAKHPQLLHEARVLKVLQGLPGFPKLFFFGHHRGYHVMILERLGPTLESVFSDWGRRRMPLPLVGMFGVQMLERLEAMHKKYIVHRDVKPENFLLGQFDATARSTLVYCIDFGLAKHYVDPKTRQHVPYSAGRSLTGTARYASVNAHEGVEPSRRDDIISVGYSLIYFANGGRLPWQGLQASCRESKYDKIVLKKKTITATELCANLPHQFTIFMSRVLDLRFTEEPPYELVKDLMKQVIFIGRSPASDMLSSGVPTSPTSLSTKPGNLNSRECETSDTLPKKYLENCRQFDSGMFPAGARTTRTATSDKMMRLMAQLMVTTDSIEVGDGTARLPLKQLSSPKTINTSGWLQNLATPPAQKKKTHRSWFICASGIDNDKHNQWL